MAVSLQPEPAKVNIDSLALALASNRSDGKYKDRDFSISAKFTDGSYWQDITEELWAAPQETWETLVVRNTYELDIKYHGVKVHSSKGIIDIGNVQTSSSLESHPNALWITQLQRAYERMRNQNDEDRNT